MKTKIKKLLLFLCALSQFTFLPLTEAQNIPSSPFIGEEVRSSSISSQKPQVTYPYTQTFLISAYYSPMLGQDKYVTGSYDSDITLNGSGVHGADGTDVYPGMVAAPSNYPFGTKMKIPGIGTVAVHDRGGAIVQSGERQNNYDRLDVWMGYGDTGLQRALNWGKRSVEVTVYGIDANVKEKITLADYNPNEKSLAEQKAVAALQKAQEEAVKAKEPEKQNAQETQSTNASEEKIQSRILFEKPDTTSIQTEAKSSTTIAFSGTLQLGDSGENVKKLQQELQNIHLLGIEPSGYYGDVTAHAIFKFQQRHGLVKDENSVGAGIFGPQTQNLLNNLVAEREEIQGRMR